jgi:manganese transport protein
MREHNPKSLEEVHGSVAVGQTGSVWKKIAAFFGPAYLISVGYMDPGNWATDLAGGSQFGYKLIWVLLMSNIMALLLQGLSARLGIVRGRDLAQASRETYSRPVNFVLYLLAEIAIVACDLAEVLGMAIGLQLLFDIPLLWGVCITVLDTFLLLFLINKGVRKMEAFIIALILVIGVSFIVEMYLAQPVLSEVATGLVPSLPNSTALYIAIGIIGATVMPHNLYLHSSLVQTRKFSKSKPGLRQAIKYNLIDSAIALNLAFFVNAAILILAAATFYKNGLFEVAEIQDAHQLLAPLLGSKWAAILFALALIAAGQSSTITGTLAGQIVMEGYLNIRIQPWVRRIITRIIAIAPALFTVIYFGERSTGDLLVLSQVVLSLQLGFAIIPLIHFVSDKKKMGDFAIGKLTKLVSWAVALTIVALNVKLVYDEITAWLHTASNPYWVWFLVVPVALGFMVLLLYIFFKPVLAKPGKAIKQVPHISEAVFNEKPQALNYRKIAVALDFSEADRQAIQRALQLGQRDATYTLIHVVETPGAIVYGKQIDDFETESDKQYLEAYSGHLKKMGYKTETRLGFGNPKRKIPDIINGGSYDILVMGAHGHKLFKDLLLGTTVDTVRHRIAIPVLIVRG